MPFVDNVQLRLHYEKHKSEFTFPDEIRYLAEAEAFMAGVAVSPTRECVRPDGDRVRFNLFTRYFGVDDGRGIIRTFFKPEEKYIAKGFFKFECQRGTSDL